MKLVRPVSEEKRRELQRDLEAQEQRLRAAASRAADALQQNLSIAKWIQQYPVESALFLVAGGIAIGRFFSKKPQGKYSKTPVELA